MTNTAVQNGESLEVLGTCTTNTKPDSTHAAQVEYKHLWSYAQQAALIAVSEKNPKTQCYRLIPDPERRAKRIAGHYADLYFKSGEKSKKRVQFYWVALAAFVVKDIVEAFRFAREEVLQREWNDVASAARNSAFADLGSLALTQDSPYQHALRTYAALAKGNLWLFMDIYPWLWFFLEYGIEPDGSLNRQRLSGCLPERNWETFQFASKSAVEQLPFGPKWVGRFKEWLQKDTVYNEASKFFSSPPKWGMNDGYGAYVAAERFAHIHCREKVGTYDSDYRTPSSRYWSKFKEAYYVMHSEHLEMDRISNDVNALNAVIKARQFRSSNAIETAFSQLIKEYDATDKFNFQKAELVAIAEQEQINVLQPLIYNDAKLKQTMDVNHRFSRLTGGWLSPKFKVIYSAAPTNSNAEYETVFDPPTWWGNQLAGERKSLPDQDDRMDFVAKIAADFNKLMQNKRPYMEAELRKIQRWVTA